jgi:hypothetical protein
MREVEAFFDGLLGMVNEALDMKKRKIDKMGLVRWF